MTVDTLGVRCPARDLPADGAASLPDCALLPTEQTNV